MGYPEMEPRDKPYRFAREASPWAPKVGFHLGTVSWQFNGTSVIAWVIEGPAIDQMLFRIMTVSFPSKGPAVTNYMRLSAQGSLITQAQELPSIPFASGLGFTWNADAGAFKSLTGEVVASSVRSADGKSPDGALIRLITGQSPDIIVTITSARQGWELLCWGVVAVGALVCMSGCTNVEVHNYGPGQVTVTVTPSGTSVAGTGSATTPFGSGQISGGVAVGPAASSTAATTSASGTTK